MKKENSIKYIVTTAIVLLAVIIGLISGFGWLGANAEEVWTLCNTESYVNIRSRASGRSFILGYAECGDYFTTDGKIRNGFLHVNAPTDTGDGWIYLGYIVYDPPFLPEADTYIVKSNGRVATRQTIDGKRNRWLKSGAEVVVYALSEEWASTNRGFVKTQYLIPKDDVDENYHNVP